MRRIKKEINALRSLREDKLRNRSEMEKLWTFDIAEIGFLPPENDMRKKQNDNH